ncbi:mannosylglycoprotein endo-beta-mannosidase [Ranunculus cassubicifolius]
MLTVDNLKRRGFQMPNRCVFCKRMEESINHLFVACDFTRKIWEYFFKSVELDFDPGKSVLELIRHLGFPSLSRFGKCIWDLLFHAVCWNVWLERNGRIFENEESNVHMLIFKIKKTLWEWSLLEKNVRGVTLENVIFNWQTVIAF